MHQLINNFFNLAILQQAFPILLTGFKYSVLVAVLTIVLGIGFGLLLTIIRCLEYRVLNAIIALYIDVFRTLPQLVVLVLIYFGFPYAGMTPSPLVTVVMGLGAILSAFASEIFWSAIKALPRGQWDAAYALGFGYFRTLFSIMLPQAIRLAVPLLTNRAIAVSKGAALATAVSLPETLGQAESLIGTLANASPLTLAAGFYLLLFVPLVIMSRWLERRYGTVGKVTK